MIQKKQQYKQSGMTMVELMIALLIGLLLSAAIITVYISNKNTFWQTEAAASMQDNALFAKRLIGDEIQHAKYPGEIAVSSDKIDYKGMTLIDDCGPTGVKKLAELPGVFAINFNSISVHLPACLTKSDIKVGTDILFIKRSAREAPASFTDIKNEKLYVKVTGVDSGELFIGADIASVSTHYVHGGDDLDTIREFICRVYYIHHPAGTVFPQLRRKTLRKNGSNWEWFTETVADGIEDIHFQFGVDTTPVQNEKNKVDRYLTADLVNAAHWNEVEAIKMFILTQSTRSDSGFIDKKTYNYRGTDYTPANGSYASYHRKLHQTTFMITNK